MGLVVIIVAALTILGVAALGLVLAQKGATPTATAASTVYIASVTQEESPLPARAPVTQIAQATGSEASPLILRANVDAHSVSPMTAVTQAPSAATVAPNVKDQSPSTISKAMVHETARLKDDATGWDTNCKSLSLISNCSLISRRTKTSRPRAKTSTSVSSCCERRPVGRRPMRKPGSHCANKRSPFATLRSARRYIRTRDLQDRRLFSTKDHRTARSQPLR